jgi:hypothetical protein
MQVKTNTHPRNALEKVRSGFVLRGTSFHRFCTENGINRRNAEKAIRGEWRGEKAQALKSRIIDAAKGKLNE